MHVFLQNAELLPLNTARWLLYFSSSNAIPGPILSKTSDMLQDEYLLDLQPIRENSPHGGCIYICGDGAMRFAGEPGSTGEAFLHRVGIDEIRLAYRLAVERANSRDRVHRFVSNLPVLLVGLAILMLWLALPFIVHWLGLG